MHNQNKKHVEIRWWNKKVTKICRPNNEFEFNCLIFQ